MKKELSNEEIIDILTLLSTLDGFIIGKVGAHSLPDYISDQFYKVSELLANKIKETK